MRKMLTIAAVALLAACSTAPKAPANDPATLRVNVFRGASNIPIYMALERGSFARRGLKVELSFTPNSDALRSGLAAGRFEIVHAAVDNAVAMVEAAGHDVVIVAGGDSGMNDFFVRPEIKRLADMRGRVLVVDAPNTAYAVLARKILKDAGLADGKDYTLRPIGGTQARTASLNTPDGGGTMLNPPWSYIAQRAGAQSLGSTRALYGPYQASGVFVMRPWAHANAGPLERYLAAYVEGCRAAQDPALREQVLAVLQRELQLARDVAELAYKDLLTPGHGLARDCALDSKGFANVLALRAEIEGQWKGVAPPQDKFLDLSYYRRALPHATR
jgi:ABC-type nitrate/sulfonate/bicarbonate transport system substrate-binding protein